MTTIDGFDGRVITPSSPDYDERRTVWNGAIDRRPRVIVRPQGPADVAAAIRFARTAGLEVAVRGGGHNVAGTAVCDDGLVIDLADLAAVAVDPAARRARVGGGALWGDVDAATQAHGLAVTGGIVSHTGVGGLTLGGGIGWLMREHGLTVDNLAAADLVTASSEQLTVSDDHHPDLFWALRGGGGNFGVVTAFEFDLHRVGPEVLAGPLFWSAEDVADVLAQYADVVADAPRQLGTVVRFGTIPPLAAVPAELHWRPAVAISVCWTGPIEAGEEVLRPLRSFRRPLLDLCVQKPYVAHQGSLDAAVPHGWHYYWKSTDLPPLDDALLEVLAAHAFEAASPRSYAVMFHLGGAIRDVAGDATAFAGRDAAHNLNVNAVWQPGEDARGERDVAWTRRFFAALEPQSRGVYLNFLDADDDQARVREAFGPTYDRLARLKAEYDSDNVFHHNHNIAPAR